MVESIHTQSVKVTKSVTSRKPPTAKPGSRAGIPNKATGLAREAIAKLVDGNADRLAGWLDQIAADEKHGPMAAWRCMMDVLEYHIPKLARTEHTGVNGKDLTVNAKVTFVRPPPRGD